MEEVQKNEMGTTVPETDGRPLKEEKPKRELTPQQAQQRKKLIVFPVSVPILPLPAGRPA